jgi:hypothetical protein
MGDFNPLNLHAALIFHETPVTVIANDLKLTIAAPIN